MYIISPDALTGIIEKFLGFLNGIKK